MGGFTIGTPSQQTLGSIFGGGQPAFGTTTASPGGGLMNSIMGGLNTGIGTITGMINPIMGLANTFAGLAGAFKDPLGEKSKRTIEQNMRNIYDRWKAGAMDSDTAIAAIQAQAASSAGHENLDQSAQMQAFAQSFINDIAAQRQQDVGAQWGSLNQGMIKPGGNGTFAEDYGHGPGLTVGEAAHGIMGNVNEKVSLTGSPEFQRQRGSSLMRNLLFNTESGQAFGNDTGLNRLTANRADPGNLYNKYYNPQPPTAIAGTQGVGTKISDALNKFGGGY